VGSLLGRLALLGGHPGSRARCSADRSRPAVPGRALADGQGRARPGLGGHRAGPRAHPGRRALAARPELAQVLDEIEGIGPERCSAGSPRPWSSSPRCSELARGSTLAGASSRFPVPGSRAHRGRSATVCPWRCSSVAPGPELGRVAGAAVCPWRGRGQHRGRGRALARSSAGCSLLSTWPRGLDDGPGVALLGGRRVRELGNRSPLVRTGRGFAPVPGRGNRSEPGTARAGARPGARRGPGPRPRSWARCSRSPAAVALLGGMFAALDVAQVLDDGPGRGAARRPFPGPRPAARRASPRPWRAAPCSQVT
jgi:hypothetical protein